MQRSTRAAVALALVASLALAACGGGGGGDDTAAPTSAGTDSTTTAGETTTSSTSTTVATTTTPPPPPPTYPLTGLPMDDAAKGARPALAMKIDNHPSQSRPQSGLNQADVVVEETVDGGLSRFVAIFQSKDADPVGPIRSARTSDPYILADFGDVTLFGNSGGNQGVLSDIRSKDFLVDVGQSSAIGGRLYFRNRDVHRGVAYEHTLYSKTEDLYAAAADAGGTTPRFPFTFRPAGVGLPASAVPVAGVGLGFAGVTVAYNWNPATSSWDRTQNGTPHVDQAGELISPENVVVLFVPYGRSAADANTPEARPVGTGDAWVFTGGSLVQATWNRADLAAPYTLTDPAGQPVTLSPGQTFVELPTEGNAAII